MGDDNLKGSTRRLALSTKVEGPPAEIQVIPFGRHETANGPFVLDGDGMSEIIRDFDSRCNEMVIDYEHQSLGSGEAPAAGWVKALVNRGRDGLWAAVQWTERARQYLKGREYRYLSPVFLKRISDDSVRRLLSAALTNTPAIDGMVPLVNNAPAALRPGKKHLEPFGGNPALAVSGKKEEKVMRELLAALGLGPDASEEEALAALKDISRGHSAIAASELLAELGLKEGASLSEALGTVAALRAAAEQAGELQELRQKLLGMEAAEMVSAAMKEGKVTPAQRDWAMGYALSDPEAFGVFAAKAPVVVLAAEIASGAGARAPLARTDELQVSVNRLLMIPDEAFDKFKPGHGSPQKEG